MEETDWAAIKSRIQTDHEIYTKIRDQLEKDFVIVPKKALFLVGTAVAFVTIIAGFYGFDRARLKAEAVFQSKLAEESEKTLQETTQTARAEALIISQKTAVETAKSATELAFSKTQEIATLAASHQARLVASQEAARISAELLDSQLSNELARRLQETNAALKASELQLRSLRDFTQFLKRVEQLEELQAVGAGKVQELLAQVATVFHLASQTRDKDGVSLEKILGAVWEGAPRLRAQAGVAPRSSWCTAENLAKALTRSGFGAED